MNNLTVHECKGVLVVDSRLIAIELGIKHGDWMRNIVKKYQKQAEQAFGGLRFENGVPDKPTGNPPQFVYLTEEQSIFFMTLSRNTEKVVQCKIKLVKAFSEAKKLLEKAHRPLGGSLRVRTEQETRSAQSYNESNNPPLPSARERLQNISLGMDLLEDLGGWDERTAILLKDQVRNILLGDQLQPSLTQNSQTEPPRLEYPVSDRAIDLGYRPTHGQLLQIGKRVKKLYLERHGTEPVKREQFVGGTTRMVNVYGFEDLDLLDEAIGLVMDKK